MKRGDIYYVERVYNSEVGSEQHSGRPALIISNDILNESSDVVIVVYMTSKPKKNLPTHRIITTTGRASTVLCEQIYTVSKQRLKNYVGSLTDEELASIENALKCSLELTSTSSGVEPTGTAQSLADELAAAKERLRLEEAARRNSEMQATQLAEQIKDTLAELKVYTEFCDKLLDRLSGGAADV